MRAVTEASSSRSPSRAMLSSQTWRLKRRSASKCTWAAPTSMPSAARSAATPSRSSSATLASADTSPGSTAASDRTRSRRMSAVAAPKAERTDDSSGTSTRPMPRAVAISG